MFSVTESQSLAPAVTLLKVNAPSVAAQAKAGQFVVVRVDERGERIPLTLADWDRDGGTIDLVLLQVGTSTNKLGSLGPGEPIQDVVGPLGKPFPIKDYGRVACVGGGVGVPAVLPIAKALSEHGNDITGIMGARTSELLILTDQMEAACSRLLLATDDGSEGAKGFVTDVLKPLLGQLDLVVAVGPVPMMAAVAAQCEGVVPAKVSLNPIMVDGTGMCGACRVTVAGEVKFACVDGPDFDAADVNFKELANRNRQYVDAEHTAVRCWEESR